jgi:hypothetical protein
MEKLLPDVQRLQSLRDRGMTYKQIASWIEEKEGVKVSPASVGAALSRAGVTKARPRYERHLPWVVHTDHIKHYAARMLRLLGRRDAGLPMSEIDTQRLDAWLSKLREEHALVVYVPDSEEGFYYVDGDWPRDGIPIVKPSSPGRRAV